MTNSRDYRDELIRASLSVDLSTLEPLRKELLYAKVNGSRVFVAGNGGSAANAAHFTGHLREKGLNAYCLSDNVPLLTASGNDFGYDQAFLRAVPAGATQITDIVIIFSCSGDSPNVLKLLERNGSKISFLGRNGRGKAASMSQVVVAVNSESFPVIEDIHSSLLHMVYEGL